MSNEITTQSMSNDERKKLWDEVAADEAGDSSQDRATSQATSDAVAALQSASAQTPAAEATGNHAQTDAQPSERFAGLPQEVRDYMAGLQTQVEQLSNRVRSNEGSIGGLKNAIQRQREAAQAVREAGGTAPTDTQIRDAQASGQRAIDKLKDTYPEFADQLQDVLREELAGVRGNQAKQEQVATAEQPQGLSQDDRVALAKRDAFIEAKGFPGFQDRIKQPDFVGWFNRQPAEVQMLGHSPDPAHAVRLLEIHRDQSKGATAGNGLDRFAGLSDINRAGGSQQRGTKTVEEMTPKEFWNHLAAEEKQRDQRG